MVFTFILCVCVALMGVFHLRKTPKNKWSNCCLLTVREDYKFLENMQNGWLCETLENQKFSSLPTFSSAWQVTHFLTNLFQKLQLSLFKADNKYILPFQLNFVCKANVMNGFSVTESREVSLIGNRYHFSVDYNYSDKFDILNIHKYLMTVCAEMYQTADWMISYL